MMQTTEDINAQAIQTLFPGPNFSRVGHKLIASYLSESHKDDFGNWHTTTRPRLSIDTDEAFDSHKAGKLIIQKLEGIASDLGVYQEIGFKPFLEDRNSRGYFSLEIDLTSPAVTEAIAGLLEAKKNADQATILKEIASHSNDMSLENKKVFLDAIAKAMGIEASISIKGARVDKQRT